MSKTNYALFQKGKQISKWYPLKEQALAHAYEKGLVGYGRGKLFPFCEIKTDLQCMNKQQLSDKGSE